VTLARRGRLPFVRATVAALGLTLLAGCGDGGGRERHGDAVRFPIPADIAGLDFSRASDTVTRTVLELISEPLVTFDQQLEIVPAAAESWEWSEDGLRLRFTLRDGLVWHDGRPVTAGDVVHTWRTETDPLASDPGRAAGFNLVRSVEQVDDRSVLVTYERPFAPALASWSTVPLLPAHVPAGADPPVGCGRWILERWDSGERIVLRSHDAHPEGPTLIPRLELEVVPDYSTRLAALLAGRLHFASLLPRQWQAHRGDPEFMARHAVHEYRVPYYWYIAWRMDGSNPFFEDARVRRAMTMAIDRGGYLAALEGSAAPLPVSSFHPSGWAFDPAIEPWPFDPARAGGLLDAAGWSLGPGGGRERAGTRLSFTLTYAQASAENEKIAAFVQDGLGRIGVEVRLEPLEYAVLLERLRERKFEALMSGMRLDPDPDPFDLWHSSQIDAGRNYAGLADGSLDAWIESARETLDRRERTRLYSLVQRRLHELEPQTTFFYPTSRVAVVEELQAVEVGPLGPLRGRPGPAGWSWKDSGTRGESR
jgi:peptide/nickel transport system substrate-binding protein